MNRFSKSSALGAADPAGQPLQHYDQPQQWPNQDQGPDADPLDGTDPAGDQDDDLEADDDLPVDLPETKGSEVPEALKAERRKTKKLMAWLWVCWQTVIDSCLLSVNDAN